MDSDDSFTIYPVSTFSEESGYVINTDSKDTLRKFVQKFRQEVFPGDFFVVSDSLQSKISMKYSKRSEIAPKDNVSIIRERTLLISMNFFRY